MYTDFLIYPGGYEDIDGGHMIGFLLKKTSDGKYDVILSNSGEGVYKHHYILDRHGEKMYKCLIRKTGLQKVDYLNLIKILLLYDQLFYANIELFYEDVISVFRDLNSNDDDTLLSIGYMYPQLSGSCTFYSLYHLNRYHMLYTDNNSIIYDGYVSALKLTSSEQMIQYIENQSIIYDNWINYINILKFNKYIDEDRYNDLINRHIESVKLCTKMEIHSPRDIPYKYYMSIITSSYSNFILFEYDSDILEDVLSKFIAYINDIKEKNINKLLNIYMA